MKAKHMVKFLENFSYQYPDVEVGSIGISEVPSKTEREGSIRIYIQKDVKTIKHYTLTYKIDKNDVIYFKEEN